MLVLYPEDRTSSKTQIMVTPALRGTTLLVAVGLAAAVLLLTIQNVDADKWFKGTHS
jgi:hypothetical protein